MRKWWGSLGVVIWLSWGYVENPLTAKESVSPDVKWKMINSFFTYCHLE